MLTFGIFESGKGFEDFDKGKEEFRGIKRDFVIGMGKNVPNAIQTQANNIDIFCLYICQSF